MLARKFKIYFRVHRAYVVKSVNRAFVEGEQSTICITKSFPIVSN